jgi:hypothetical protein
MNTTWELEVGSWKFSDSHLSVSPVALAARRFRLRLTPPIGRKGSTDVIHLLEASLLVATRVHLVSTGIDQLAFRCAMCHLRLLADSTQIEYPQVAASPQSAELSGLSDFPLRYSADARTTSALSLVR